MIEADGEELIPCHPVNCPPEKEVEVRALYVDVAAVIAKMREDGKIK